MHAPTAKALLFADHPSKEPYQSNFCINIFFEIVSESERARGPEAEDDKYQWARVFH